MERVTTQRCTLTGLLQETWNTSSIHLSFQTRNDTSIHSGIVAGSSVQPRTTSQTFHIHVSHLFLQNIDFALFDLEHVLHVPDFPSERALLLGEVLQLFGLLVQEGLFLLQTQAQSIDLDGGTVQTGRQSRGMKTNVFPLRLPTWNTFAYLCLQDGSTLLFGSERFFEHLDMLFAVRVLVVESLELRLQSQQLRLLLRQLLLQLVDLNASKPVFGEKRSRPRCVFMCKREKN